LLLLFHMPRNVRFPFISEYAPRVHSRESVKSKATARSQAAKATSGDEVEANSSATKDKFPDLEPKKDFIEENRKALAAKSKLTTAQKVFRSILKGDLFCSNVP
jgi:hypothetical protein